MYSLCEPIPGGSPHNIQWDDETITVHLPPVGYTIDRIPDPTTGKPSFELIKCEILNLGLPVEEMRWRRTEIPADYIKWRREEVARRRYEPFYFHPGAEAFRKQEWTRKINGVWVALGNRSGKDPKFVYLTGQAYDFFNWWQQDFGYPRLRLVLLKVFHSMQYVKDHPLLNGLTLSTNRRFGKTSISMHNLWYEASFKPKYRAGMQAQTRNDAADKWEESFLFGWRHQPHFFLPKWDTTTKNKSDLVFVDRGDVTGKAAMKAAIDDAEQVWGGLNSKIDYRETHATSYDGYKLHNYSFEEPGKWVEEDIYLTLRTIIPSTMDNYKKIGFILAPTTIEELEKGGDKFIELFEDSRPSLMAKNENGKTTSRLIALFISSAEGYVFDEYGNSIVEDPEKDEVVIGEDGLRIFEGAKTRILRDRKPLAGNYQLLTQQIRQYPLTWDEAKMMNTADSPFNVMKLQKRLDQLEAMPSNLFITGNFDWVDKEDGDVDFFRDDLNGRWHIGKLLDIELKQSDPDKRLKNRVGVEFIEGKRVWYPKNTKSFRFGADPIRYVKTDNPRSSRASTYGFELLNPSVDTNVAKQNWKTHNFFAEYFHRPSEFSVYGEDMIKALRYYGAPILAEENVNNLRQYLEARGYGQFVLFKGDFDSTVIRQTSSQEDAYKGLSSVDEVVSAGIQRLISFVENHSHRMIFPIQIRQMIQFVIKDRTKYDAVMGSIFTMLATEAKISEYMEEEIDDITEILPLYDQSGNRSKLAKV